MSNPTQILNTLHPTQIGYTPTGNYNSVSTSSTLYLGRNAGVTWEAIGFGQDGRPDYLENLVINLTQVGTPNQTIASIVMSVTGIQAIIAASPNAAAQALSLTLREVSVCDAGVAKKMIVLASPTYT